MSRFLGHGVRTGLPNSVDRNINWAHLMEIRAEQHQKRVDKPGKTTKCTFEIGEDVWVQDVKSKKWDKEGTITNVRVAYDGKIVSYDLKVNGADAIRHRRYLRKKLDSSEHDLVAAESNSQAGLERATAEQGPRRSSRQAARQLQ